MSNGDVIILLQAITTAKGRDFEGRTYAISALYALQCISLIFLLLEIVHDNYHF